MLGSINRHYAAEARRKKENVTLFNSLGTMMNFGIGASGFGDENGGFKVGYFVNIRRLHVCP